jgi:hypothetical protein
VLYAVIIVAVIGIVVFCIIFTLSDGWCCLFKTCLCMIKLNRCLFGSFGSRMGQLSDGIKIPKKKKKKTKKEDKENNNTSNSSSSSSSDEEDDDELSLEEIIEKKKMIHLNLNKKVKFLPRDAGKSFSLAGYIKKKKIEGSTYYTFHLGERNYQIYEFKENQYIDLSTPEKISKQILRKEKKKFISTVDVTLNAKYKVINF